MMLPNTSDRIVEQYGKTGLNPYWEGLLPERERSCLAGFDFACECYRNAFLNMIGEVDEEEFEIFPEVKKKVYKYTQTNVEEHIASDREQYIVALLEDAEDKEYSENYRKELEKAREEFGKEIADLYGLEEDANGIQIISAY